MEGPSQSRSDARNDKVSFGPILRQSSSITSEQASPEVLIQIETLYSDIQFSDLEQAALTSFGVFVRPASQSKYACDLGPIDEFEVLVLPAFRIAVVLDN